MCMGRRSQRYGMEPGHYVIRLSLMRMACRGAGSQKTSKPMCTAVRLMWIFGLIDSQFLTLFVCRLARLFLCLKQGDGDRNGSEDPRYEPVLHEPGWRGDCRCRLRDRNQRH